MDITRSIDARDHRYTALVAQQGRVTTDDDLNEGHRLAAEADRLRTLDVVGPSATPDDGFRIAAVTTAGGPLDFTIGAGTYYVGGHRLTHARDSTYRDQPDWRSPDPVTLGSRTLLAYLEVSEQDVSPFEDTELFEAALGGVDTAGRRRLMWRVRVADIGTAQSCERARQRLAEELADDGLGTLQLDGELTVDTRLHIGFTSVGGADLCAPTAGGFAGAENQLLRVQLTGANTFTWGYDNAAPVYRVTVAGRELTLLNPPRDVAHHPRDQQVVEVLPQTATLPNGEPVAARTGFLTTIETPYDSATGALTLAEDLPAWLPVVDGGNPLPVFMRVWSRGGDTGSPAHIPFVPGVPVALGTTGLTATFAGDDRSTGDHWLVAVRPGTPEVVVPWRLHTEPGGTRPHGVRRFVAPLARISRRDGSIVVDDCRLPFRPLPVDDCCRVCVDPSNWIEVLHRLTADRQWQDLAVCFAPGSYELPAGEDFRFEQRRAVRLTGQGRGTVIRARDRERVWGFKDVEHVVVESMTILVSGEARSAEKGLADDIRGLVDVRSVRTARVHDVVARTLAAPRPAMACVVIAGTYRAEAPGADVVVEGCTLVPGANQVGVLATDTERVVVRDNVIGRFAQIRTKQGHLGRMLRDPGYAHRMRRLLFFDLRMLDRGERLGAGETRLDSEEGGIAFRSIGGLGDAVVGYLRARLGDTSGMSNRSLRAAAEGALGAPLRKDTDVPVFRRLRQIVVPNRPPASATGVVVAGRRADSVRVTGNDISDTRTGIVVALSHGDGAVHTAGRVQVTDNLLWLLVTLEGIGLPHRGVQVGHARAVDVRDNEIRTDHKAHVKELRMPTEGVRLYGRFGAQPRVDGNTFADLATGIRLRHLGEDHGSAGVGHRNRFVDVATEQA
jgi:hypothetical protein